MKNQSIQLINLFLHSTLMIRPTFLRYFIPYFCIFYATPSFTTRTGTGRNKKAAGRERPTTCTCPWQVILFPKSPRFWKGLLPASSTPLPTTHPFVGGIAAAQRFDCSSRLKPPVIQTGHSLQPLTEDVPTVDPRIRIVRRLQTGRKLVGLCIRSRFAPILAVSISPHF